MENTNQRKRLQAAFEVVRVIAGAAEDTDGRVNLSEMMMILQGTREILDEVFMKKEISDFNEQIKTTFKTAQANIEKAEEKAKQGGVQ